MSTEPGPGGYPPIASFHRVAHRPRTPARWRPPSRTPGPDGTEEIRVEISPQLHPSSGLGGRWPSAGGWTAVSPRRVKSAVCGLHVRLAGMRRLRIGGEGGSVSSDLVNASSAGGAADAAREVGVQASDQARVVVGEAREQFGQLVGRTQEELRGRAAEQSDRAAGALRTLAGQLGALSEGRSVEAGPLAGYVGEAQVQVERFARRLSDRGPQGVLEDLAGFARRKPAVFLVLAGGAGFAVGRVTRSGIAAHKETSESLSSASPALAAPSAPVSPVSSMGVPAVSTEVPPSVGARR